MSFTLAVSIIMFLVPTLTSIVVFGVPKLIKFLREQG